MSSSYAIAAKAMIFNNRGEVLLLKRRPSDVHNPSTWDIPGGRLEEEESPFDGVVRETHEESGLSIEVHEPLGIHYFTRQDGQHITMIVFRCSHKEGEVILSEEHTEFQWLSLPEAKETVHEAFQGDLETFERYYSGH